MRRYPRYYTPLVSDYVVMKLLLNKLQELLGEATKSGRIYKSRTQPGKTTEVEQIKPNRPRL